GRKTGGGGEATAEGLASWQRLILTKYRRFEQRALDRKRAQDQRTVEMLGGNRFEILHFYASPGVIRRGQTAQLCYGVSGAKTVRLEPQPNAVWPSFSRCVDVCPSYDTSYTVDRRSIWGTRAYSNGGGVS